METFERRALIARSLSVAGNPDWMPAKDARSIGYTVANPINAGDAVIELAKFGFLTGRAVLAQGSTGGRDEHDWSWQEREWNIAPWFWTEFTTHGQSTQDWSLGKFSGKGAGPSGLRWITLSGVYFHRESMAALGGAKVEPALVESGRRGRKSEYDWTAATSAIWGQLYRGELKPKVQADIEQALIGYLRDGDKMPVESTVRPYAKPIWEEIQKP